MNEADALSVHPRHQDWSVCYNGGEPENTYGEDVEYSELPHLYRARDKRIQTFRRWQDRLPVQNEISATFSAVFSDARDGGGQRMPMTEGTLTRTGRQWQPYPTSLTLVFMRVSPSIIYCIKPLPSFSLRRDVNVTPSSCKRAHRRSSKASMTKSDSRTHGVMANSRWWDCYAV